MRIVSLLPSATEIICSLGLEPYLVGVTHECDFPLTVQGLPVITQTRIPKGLASSEIDDIVRNQLETNSALYSLRMDILEELQPDLIVTQALCDVCAVSGDEVIQAARKLASKPQVVNLEPSSLEEVFDTIKLVGSAANAEHDTSIYLQSLQARVVAITKQSDLIAMSKRPKVAMLEWLDPLFNAGHWTPQLVNMAGGVECLGKIYQASHTINWQTLADCDADVICIALCGFDIERSKQDLIYLTEHSGWQSLTAVKNKQVYVVNGNAYFSRSGPRLVDSLELIAHLLHPQLFTLPSYIEPTINIFDA
ncbi:cobalamin-binding protein [Thalassomonas sp. M1454]|uniref:cobalamin-binding protein n=1 Tax=Thalassomonas sp. M1454 TaxID=2594477 RepID=UPI0011812AF1|nr:cobalamin-binding protein [Thalassomonas sp. M1454]TRX56321.1 cobalamin-binding protein [Thalassomonas sp. M1454]